MWLIFFFLHALYAAMAADDLVLVSGAGDPPDDDVLEQGRMVERLDQVINLELLAAGVLARPELG